METLKTKPGIFLDHNNIKPEWVRMCKVLPVALQNSLLSSIFSTLSKIPVVAQHQKSEEVILAMCFLTGKVRSGLDGAGSGDSNSGLINMNIIQDQKTKWRL